MKVQSQGIKIKRPLAAGSPVFHCRIQQAPSASAPTSTEKRLANNTETSAQQHYNTSTKRSRLKWHHLNDGSSAMTPSNGKILLHIQYWLLH